MSFTLIAILSAFFGAVSNVWTKPLLRDIPAKDLIKWSFLTHGLLLLIVSPFFFYFEISRLTLGLFVLVAFIDWMANYYFFKTFEKAEASVATPLLSLSPAFTFLFSWLFIGEIVSIKTYILATAIIILIAIFSIDFSNFKKFRGDTLMPALIASLLFGISAIPSKMLLTELHAINPPTLVMLRAFLIAFFAFCFLRERVQPITRRQYGSIVGRSILIILSWVLLYVSFERGSAGVALTLGNTTPIFVFILSAIFLREKPTIKKVIAAGLILAFSLII